MEIESQKEKITNNNEFECAQNNEEEKNLIATSSLTSSLNSKDIEKKQEGTTSEGNDLNCSIVSDNNVNSELKITFKVQKKLKKSIESVSKENEISVKNAVEQEVFNHAHTNNNAVEKVGKIVIKDTHGEFSIKAMERKEKYEKCSLESDKSDSTIKAGQAILKDPDGLSNKNPIVEGGGDFSKQSLCKLNDECDNIQTSPEEILTNETGIIRNVEASENLPDKMKNYKSGDNKEVSNGNDHSPGATSVAQPSTSSVCKDAEHLEGNKGDHDDQNNAVDNSEDVNSNNRPRAKNSLIGKKRKGEMLDFSSPDDVLCANHEKTDTIDCNKQITPWTKRRKLNNKRKTKFEQGENCTPVDSNKSSISQETNLNLEDAESPTKSFIDEESSSQNKNKIDNEQKLNSTMSKRSRKQSSEQNEPKQKRFKCKETLLINENVSNEVSVHISQDTKRKGKKRGKQDVNQSTVQSEEIGDLSGEKIIVNSDNTNHDNINLMKSEATKLDETKNRELDSSCNVSSSNIESISEKDLVFKSNLLNENLGKSDEPKKLSNKNISAITNSPNKVNSNLSSDNRLDKSVKSSPHSTRTNTPSPIQSPSLKDAKKITLEDFLKELNEESKNIKEGDEIPVNENEQPSVIVTEEEKKKVVPGEKEDISNVMDNKTVKKLENEAGNKEVSVDSNRKVSDIELLKETVSLSLIQNENVNRFDVSISNTSELRKDDIEVKTESQEANLQNESSSVSEVDAKVKYNVVQEATIEEKINLKEKLDVDNSKMSSVDITEKQISSDVKDNPSSLESDKKLYGQGDVSKKEEANTEALVKDSELYKSESERNISNEAETELKSSNKTDIEPSKSSKEDLSGDLEMTSEDSSDSSDGSDSSDDSSSSSSDSDSSSDSESESGSSDSDSSDSENVNKKQVDSVQVTPNVVRHKKLKIRNAPSLSQDSLNKSESSSSNPLKGSESSNDTTEKLEIKESVETSSSSTTAHAPVATLSQQILSGTPNTCTPVRKRGRPRKYPLPNQLQVTPDTSVVKVEQKVEKDVKNEDEFRPQVCRRGRKKGQRKRKPGRPKKNAKPFPIIAKKERDPNAPRRGRGRPKKIKDPPEPTVVNLSDQLNMPQDKLSEQLMQLENQFSLMVNSIPGMEEQNSSEITDNRLLEEINSGLDVITEEIVSEDVSNYLGTPVDEILQFPEATIKQESLGSQNSQEEQKHVKHLKTEEPAYHRKYYKYVKIPKDQQKKRGPKKRIFTEVRVVKRPKSERKRGRPRKSENLGARPAVAPMKEEETKEYDESLSKELENLNRSMENILTSDVENDKDFTVAAHVKFEALPEDQLKRSNRPSKSQVLSFSEFDEHMDALIERAATEDENTKPKYKYYEKIPKHLQKKRGRPRKTDNPDEPKKEPKPKVEKPPKVKKSVIKEDGTEAIEEEERFIEFDEEDEYEEDIDDEDKDKDFNIQDYIKKEKNVVQIDENLDFEEVYPVRERMIKTKKVNPRFGMLSKFNKFGKFGNKMRRPVLPRRGNNVNACMYRYVRVCDKDFNPIALVQRMYCTKVAPATYDIAERYRPNVKLRRLINNDITDFFDKYWCDQCEISFLNTRISKQRHMYIYHTEEVECELCDRTISNRYNLKKHKEIFHKRKIYTCKVCSEEYKKYKAFQMHVWEAHPIVKNRDRAYFCNICQCVFYRKESFKFHYHEHLNGNIFEHFDTTLADMEFMLKQMIF